MHKKHDHEQQMEITNGKVLINKNHSNLKESNSKDDPNRKNMFKKL
jgi:hypothetical protein